MTETAADKVQHERIPRRRKRRLEGDFSFSTVNRKVKRANNMGNNDKHFWRPREQRKNFGIKETRPKTSSFINVEEGNKCFFNGEQGIKTKQIKGSS